jgi:hypothetical protein
MNVDGDVSCILLFLDCGVLLRIKNCFIACLFWYFHFECGVASNLVFKSNQAIAIGAFVVAGRTHISFILLPCSVNDYLNDPDTPKPSMENLMSK